MILDEVRRAVRDGRVRLSDHALVRMVERHIDIQDAVEGIARATLLEDYSLTRNEPRVLVRQREPNGRWIHVVWEAPGPELEVVLVTVFDPKGEP